MSLLPLRANLGNARNALPFESLSLRHSQRLCASAVKARPQFTPQVSSPIAQPISLPRLRASAGKTHFQTLRSHQIKITHLHRGHDHIESLFPRCPPGRRNLLDLRQHLDQALIEAEISDTADDPPVFHQERTVA